MPIKFSCDNCGSVLRVAEQHIGKQAKCPKCGDKCTVPAESQAEPAAAASPNPFPAATPPVAPPSGFPSFGEPAAAPAAPIISPPVGPGGLPAVGNSPYSTPMAPSNSGGQLSNTIMHPLYQARGMMQWFGWTMFIIGIIYCVTIIGAIIGWLPLWMGNLMKGAATSIKVGVERGDQNQLRLANQKIATFFKICGVLSMIYAVLIALYIALILVLIITAAVGAA